MSWKIYSMGTFWEFWKSQHLHLKLPRGKIVPVYQGDEDRKIKHLQFGDWFAFLLCLCPSLSAHRLIIWCPWAACAYGSCWVRRCSVASSHCTTFFFVGVHWVLNYNKRKYFLFETQRGDWCYMTNCNFPAFLSMHLWGGMKKGAATSVVSTEIFLQSRAWFHAWCMLDETYFES